MHAAAWRGDPKEGGFCKHMRAVPWVKAYESRGAYKAEHGSEPFGASATRRMEPDEALKHSEAYCPTAWRHYQDAVKKMPVNQQAEMMWLITPLDEAVYAQRQANA